MTIRKRLLGSMVAALLACGLMAGTAFAAEGSVSLGIRCGDIGQSIRVPDVPNDAHSLQLDIVLRCDGAAAPEALRDISFVTASGPRNLRVDEARTAVSGRDAVQLTVVLSAGSQELFPGVTGDVDLGTLQMRTASGTVRATATVAAVQTLDGRYASTTREDAARAQLTVGPDGIQEAVDENTSGSDKSSGSKKPGNSKGSKDPADNGGDGGFDPASEPLYTDSGEGEGEGEGGEEAEGEADADADNHVAKRVGQSKVAEEAVPDAFPLGMVILGSVIGLAVLATIIGAIVYARNRRRP